jgi:glutamate racemase
VKALCEKYLISMGAFGHQAGQIDTLVLGCTHYPFALSLLSPLVGEKVTILETGEPVARHTQQVLAERGLLVDVGRIGRVTLIATGDSQSLHRAAFTLGI